MVQEHRHNWRLDNYYLAEDNRYGKRIAFRYCTRRGCGIGHQLVQREVRDSATLEEIQDAFDGLVEAHLDKPYYDEEPLVVKGYLPLNYETLANHKMKATEQTMEQRHREAEKKQTQIENAKKLLDEEGYVIVSK